MLLVAVSPLSTRLMLDLIVLLWKLETVVVVVVADSWSGEPASVRGGGAELDLNWGINVYNIVELYRLVLEYTT